MEKYIFVKEGGFARPTGYTTDERGNLSYFGFKDKATGNAINKNGLYPAEKIKGFGLLLSKEQFKQINQKQMKNDKYNGQTRVIDPSKSHLKPNTFNAVLDYTTFGADDPEEIEILLGDGAEYIGSRLPALPDVFVVSGNLNEATLNVLKKLSGQDQLHISEMQLAANVESWFGTAKVFSIVESDLQGNVIESPVNLEITQNGDQFNESKRLLKDFETVLYSMSAIKVKLRKGDRLSLNFKIVGAGYIRAMSKI